MTEKD